MTERDKTAGGVVLHHPLRVEVGATVSGMRLVLTLIGAGLLAASAAAAGPAFDRTSAGDAAATASLLTKVDLPARDGWNVVARAQTPASASAVTGGPELEGDHRDWRGLLPDYSSGS